MSGGWITSEKEAKKMVDLGVLPWKVGEATAERRTLTTCSTTLHRKKLIRICAILERAHTWAAVKEFLSQVDWQEQGKLRHEAGYSTKPKREKNKTKIPARRKEEK
jgi:hypothetical protein